jgi:butyrate response factor
MSEAQQCYAFRDNGYCRFGDGCRFAHGDQAPAPRGNDFGWNSNSNNSGYGRSNRRSNNNVCYSFRDYGECQFGDGCRFSHDMNGASNDNSGSGQRSGYGFNNNNRRNNNYGASKLCYSWQESGSCQYGDSCRFSHGQANEQKQRSSFRRPKQCYTFRDTGKCEYGNSCIYSHEEANDNAQPDFFEARQNADSTEAPAETSTDAAADTSANADVAPVADAAADVAALSLSEAPAAVADATN